MPMAIIWGGLKILVQCAGRYDKNLERIAEQLAKLPDLLFDLSGCEEVYGTSVYGADVVRRILGAAYTCLFEFWYSATKTLENQALSALVENRDLISVVDDLEGHWNRLCRIRDSVESQLNKTMRQHIEDESFLSERMRKEIQDEFVMAALERCAAEDERKAAEDEREAAREEREKAEEARRVAEAQIKEAKMEREKAEIERKAQQDYRHSDAERKRQEERDRLNARLNLFKDKLDVENHLNFSMKDDIKLERAPGTCKWLLEHPGFRNWKEKDCETPILWLNGKHGAGKTFICGSAVDEISSESPRKAVAFQFITKDKYWPRSHLLRNLASQLLTELQKLAIDQLPPSIESFAPVWTDAAMIESLVHDLLQVLPMTFIFIDGLDEADYIDGPESIVKAGDTSTVIKFLIKEATGLPQKVRLWCSSQASEKVRQYLLQDDWKHKVLQVPVTTVDTANDILAYMYLHQTMRGPKDANDLFLKALIAASISTEVEGSFLWARMMLGELEDLSTETEDMEDRFALIEKGLPRKMEDLYRRIMDRMRARRVSSSHKDLPLWKIVLSLLTFSKRPMRLSEIAEAIAIIRTPDGQNMNLNKLVAPAKIVDSCMSLVRRTHGGHKSGDDDLLRLSHSSVRAYLMDNSEISDPLPDTPLRFDPLTDRGIATRRTLPHWILDLEPELSRAYFTFQAEWCQLLQLTPASLYIGEIDRCFWGSLGKDNFLSQHEGRYQCFRISQVTTPANTTDSCRMQHLSPDGSTVTLMWIRMDGESRHAHIERWSTTPTPQMIEEVSRTFSVEETGIDRYPTQCSTTFSSFPVVPGLTCIVAPDAFHLSPDSTLLRVGGKFFFQKQGGSRALDFMELKGSASTESWERKKRGKTSRSIETKNVGLSAPVKIKVASQTPKQSYLSSPEDSWTEGSTDTEEPSSEEIGSDEPENSESGSEIDLRSVNDEDNAGDDLQDIEVESEYQGETSDSGSLKSVNSFSQYLISSSESEDGGYESDTFQSEWPRHEMLIEEADEHEPVQIAAPRGLVTCDACNRGNLREWYHCIVCSKADFDLCRDCVRRGRWCFNLGHRLYRMINRKPAGAVSRNNFVIRQELAVCRLGPGDSAKHIFHLRKKYNSLLYESPPVIHPKYPLVVWALTGTTLLFADFERNRFLEQKLRATSPQKSREICVNMSFSPCGDFLRASVIDAIHKPSKAGTDKTRPPKARVCMNLHVMILQLSSTSPSNSPPKMVSSANIELGCSVKTLVSTLPFAFTWTPSYLYVTMSHSTLRVYRVALNDWKPSDLSKEESCTAKDSDRQLQITVPKETIFLPRSARVRSVQFFPALETNGDSKVIIGPRYGKNPEPPLAALLQDKDLGGWVLPSKKDGSCAANDTFQRRLEGRFEDFDSDEDCDIIPLTKYL
ncbi:nacht and tpr domain protein [Colletotrichum sojae]|uniref:Nacht and tpr domain protein n=1 Tax=Colletotrichum sojae TaxID=2175907 RepID=A0A8H6MZK3_9PEZI|nr:nacht and tpr domain protein [Colletotrichum sojae]